ncbi:hypothetical protein CAGA_23960 [Caproiciproducens galactitolivorans]|uniref:Uncharacterized protein n=1 Tax=Caproiciproducens galactitolivorans TaxID=642589 RepID=A0A4Z0XY70_9FIRM|nr:hypothetical protein CAGA_23960 [Caproiciproducens galactitolivorans]
MCGSKPVWQNGFGLSYRCNDMTASLVTDTIRAETPYKKRKSLMDLLSTATKDLNTPLKHTLT